MCHRPYSGRRRVADIFIGSFVFGHQKLPPLVGQHDYHRDAAFRVQSSNVCHHRLLVLLNAYALEILLILIIIEFLVLVELTKPSVVTMAWRKNSTYLSLSAHRVRHHLIKEVTALR